MKASFTDGMAKAILENERSASRFETFCCKLFSRVDGHDYVPTSANYDQGVDGRTTKATLNSIICASLRTDVLDKAKEDADNLLKRGQKPKSIRFCSSQQLTEKTINEIKGIFRKHCNSADTVLADGSIQISHLSVQYPDIFEYEYLAELESYRSALGISETNSEQIQMTGLRIALTTQLSDDAHSLREDLHSNLILTALADGAIEDVDGICRKVSKLLSLPKIVQAGYLNTSIKLLERTKKISCHREQYQISMLGREELKRRTETGSNVLAQGQKVIRGLLRVLTGDEIEPLVFNEIWGVVQDEITNMFLANGIYVINSIESILLNKTVITDHPDLHGAINKLGDRLTQLSILGNQRKAVGQAIIDMFQEKASDAFKWLSSLGSIYVAMCSLGLEQSAQQQIQSRLCELDLIFDTDVVLSLLSSGEPQHLPVIDIVKNWERIKGHIYVAPSVLEEAAYHAWISNNNYEEVWRLLAKMNDMDAHHLIDNVFVRGFRKEAKGKYDPKSWGWYIKLFRGKTEYDYEKILEIVKEYKIDILSENIIDMEFAKQVSDTLINLKSQVGRTVSDEEIHKCKIDGRLIALLLAKRESMEQTGRSALVISSSNLFIKINEMLKYKLKEPKPIVSISAIAYLLSLVPGVNMSFDVLRRVLFDTGFPVKPVGLERFVLQMVQGSEEYFVPYAKRGSMVVNAREQIRQIAAQRGEDPNEVENKILRKDKEIKEEIAPMIAAAVDKIAISKSQRRIWELEEKIKAYEKKR